MDHCAEFIFSYLDFEVCARLMCFLRLSLLDAVILQWMHTVEPSWVVRIWKLSFSTVGDGLWQWGQRYCKTLCMSLSWSFRSFLNLAWKWQERHFNSNIFKFCCFWSLRAIQTIFICSVCFFPFNCCSSFMWNASIWTFNFHSDLAWWLHTSHNHLSTQLSLVGIVPFNVKERCSAAIYIFNLLSDC